MLVHEYYRSSSPSGEDRVFEREKELLQQNGLTVETLIFKNDFIGTKYGPSVFKTALYTAWSPIGKRMVKEAVHKFSPDLVHFHNTFPVLSQSAIYQAKKMGCATVQTLHNFRTVCAQAMLMRPEGICEKCIGKYPWPALADKCYRDSMPATAPLAANIALNRFLKTWQTKVDRIIVLSEFNKNKFIEAGFPAGKIRVKPNFFEDNMQDNNYGKDKENNWLCIGRLKEEKGVQFLPAVWKRLGEKAPLLRIVGDGPYLETLKSEINSLGLDKKIILHGHCSSEQVQELLRKSSLLVFPSIWYEGFPLVIGEAYAAGVPVAASKIGTPAHIVQNNITGVHFQPGDIDDMVKQLSFLIEHPDLLGEMGRNARKEYESKYTPERNFQMIKEIYQEAINENR
ncbi:MAG: glycosyltransferase family 4 protein [Proteobacteria bacterium]|nr:glycosyltransferase family 4 protein [Pseudomonadota bacterium]